MTQPKSFTTIDGKRCELDPLVPAADIRWLVRQHHVSATSGEIALDISSRTKDWTARHQQQAIAYALRCHADNCRLFAFTQTGF